mgnify:CR=1 FL=1
MKQKRKICGNVPVKIPAKWIEIYDCGLCLLASVLIVAGVFSAVFLSGCSVIKKDSSKVMGLEYTVVKEEEIPVELKKLIEAKKANTLRMTYATKDATYIVAGYGTQPTSGYSIRVNVSGNKCGLCRCRFIRAGGRRGYNGTANHAVYCVKNPKAGGVGGVLYVMKKQPSA